MIAATLRVTDTGVGLKRAGNGLGTGLANLRERLKLFFGDDVELRLVAREPHGACVELDFPVRRNDAAGPADR